MLQTWVLTVFPVLCTQKFHGQKLIRVALKNFMKFLIWNARGVREGAHKLKIKNFTGKFLDLQNSLPVLVKAF